MKRGLQSYHPILLALLLACSCLKAQDLAEFASGERVEAWTDRTMYVAGERILFSAAVLDDNFPAPENLSKALYCELITPAGDRIAGGKYLLQQGAGEGCLGIPEGTVTGNYFLKLYTRFMRNTGTDRYTYIPLKIIHPFLPDVLPGNDVTDTAGITVKNDAHSYSGLTMKLVSRAKTFSPREEIMLDLTGNINDDIPHRLCLSVVPEATFEVSYSLTNPHPDDTVKGLYYPETRGISLSGLLLNTETSEPIPGWKINLSIIGDKDILATMTGSTGRFFFPLPDYQGNRDIFICTGDMPGIVPEIFIDNDYCSRPVNLPSRPFGLNEQEMQAAYHLAVNALVAKTFDGEVMTQDDIGDTFEAPFYGNPTEVLLIDKYIELPTLEDYFTELPVIVKVRKIQGQKRFRFYTTQDNMLLYDPLVLIDWVAVNDMDKILAISPQAIERIEFVNSVYVRGNITYGGIVSIVSKNNDFAGIDLPTSGTFFNYQFLEPCTGSIPVEVQPLHIPDSRNTVYWDPEVEIPSDAPAIITFPAPDTPGRYRILLRGIVGTKELFLQEEIVVNSF